MIKLEDYLNSNYMYIRSFYKNGNFEISNYKILGNTNDKGYIWWSLEFFDIEEIRNLTGKVVSFKENVYLVIVSSNTCQADDFEGRTFLFRFLTLFPI